MRRIAVIVETSTQYGRILIGGISAFAQLHGWQVLFEYRGRNTAEPSWLEDFTGDGVITSSPSPTHSLKLRKAGIPVIDLGVGREAKSSEGLLIDSDHRTVGKLAAEHFIAKGHRNFAFLGYSDHTVSMERENGFRGALEAHGFEARHHHTPERTARSFAALHTGDSAFIDSLPKPCGLFYFRDVFDRPVQEYWHTMKFWWPHDEALIATLMAHRLTGESRYLDMHERCREWAFGHFADPERGEWFGYLHQDGRPSSTLKGSLWKSFFHHPRALLLCHQFGAEF